MPDFKIEKPKGLVQKVVLHASDKAATATESPLMQTKHAPPGLSEQALTDVGEVARRMLTSKRAWVRSFCLVLEKGSDF
jgi:hypothetical protein